MGIKSILSRYEIKVFLQCEGDEWDHMLFIFHKVQTSKAIIDEVKFIFVLVILWENVKKAEQQEANKSPQFLE